MALMGPVGIGVVTSQWLRLSKAAAAELAAIARQPKRDAGIEKGRADMIVVAVPTGQAGEAAERIRRVLADD